MLKRFIIVSLLIFSKLAFADGFSQFNYVNNASFNYPSSYSNSMSIGFQLSSSGGLKQLYSNIFEQSSNEDPNQVIRVYQDAGLNNSLDSNPVDLNGLADGNTHSITLYIKFLSKNSNNINSSGIFTFNYPIYINNNGTIYNATLNVSANVKGSCAFTQSSFNSYTKTTVNTVIKASTPIQYYCSPGLAATLSSDSPKYISNENTGITMSLFGDNSYLNNLATNPINLISDGNNQSQNIFIQYFENDTPYIKNVGTYNFNSTLYINY